MASKKGIHEEALRRRVRLLVILSAAEDAGLTPLALPRLHTLAFIANLMAPLWDMAAFDGKVLKRRGAPFYPDLQRDLDRLVGMGMVSVEAIDHVQDGDGRWRLDAKYSLRREFAAPVLDAIHHAYEAISQEGLTREVAYALAALPPEDLDVIMTEDATYSSTRSVLGSVIDFDEWRKRNFSVNAANTAARFMEGQTATRGEKLNLYVTHLYRRLHG